MARCRFHSKNKDGGADHGNIQWDRKMSLVIKFVVEVLGLTPFQWLAWMVGMDVTAASISSKVNVTHQIKVKKSKDNYKICSSIL